MAEGGPPDSFTFRFFPQIHSLMLFPAGVKLFFGGGDEGRESLLRLGITWSLLAGKIQTQTEANRPLQMYPTGTFPLGRWAAESQLTPGAAHPHSYADLGRLRTDAGHRERELGSQLIVSRRAPSGRRAYTPLLLESSWRPPRAGTSGTPGQLSALSRVKLLALNRTWWPKPRCPGQIHPRSAT